MKVQKLEAVKVPRMEAMMARSTEAMKVRLKVPMKVPLTEDASVLRKDLGKVEGLVYAKGKGMVLRTGWNLAEKLVEMKELKMDFHWHKWCTIDSKKDWYHHD